MEYMYSSICTSLTSSMATDAQAHDLLSFFFVSSAEDLIFAANEMLMFQHLSWIDSSKCNCECDDCGTQQINSNRRWTKSALKTENELMGVI